VLTVDDIVRAKGCDTSPTLGLSQQIAAEMVCIAGPMLDSFHLNNGLTARDAAVIPLLAPQAARALEVAASEHPITVTSAFRTVAQQHILYSWWQEKVCNIAVAVPPGESNHESGRAIDVSNFDNAGATLRKHGFEQNVPGDRVHFEHLASPDLRGLDVHGFQRLWNRNHPDDAIDEDGAYGTETSLRMARTPAAGFPDGGCDVGSQ
jgi:hypothetical protein